MTGFRLFATLAALVVLSGCGQSLSIKVERIRTVAKSDLPDFAKLDKAESDSMLRAQAAVAAENAKYLLKLVGVLEKITTVDNPAITEARSSVANIEADLSKDPLPDMQVHARVLLKNIGRLESVVAEIQKPLYDRLPGAEAHRAMLATVRNEAPTALRDAAVSANALASLSQRLQFGGYYSETLYILAPGSAAYRKLVTDASGPTERTLVYNRLEAIATGDSLLVAVQDSPAHFSLRYMKSDPTVVIKNSILVLTRVLRVASAYVPLISGVGAALGTPAEPVVGGASSASAAASAKSTVSAATEAADRFDERVRSVLNDAQLSEILTRARAKPSEKLSPADQKYVQEKIEALKAALGGV